MYGYEFMVLVLIKSWSLKLSHGFNINFIRTMQKVADWLNRNIKFIKILNKDIRFHIFFTRIGFLNEYLNSHKIENIIDL